MPLEIKILDYGDIELESSFLVLGHNCGRTRRVLTLGFLILGGQYPVVIDTGYRSNQIMETLGMRGLQFHENMIENQLMRHGVRMGDVRFVCHTHLHIDHAGKDDLFPMNTTVVVNRRELEYSVSGLMHPQYPAPDIKHLVDRLHTKSALRFLDLEITGSIELMPGINSIGPVISRSRKRSALLVCRRSTRCLMSGAGYCGCISPETEYSNSFRFSTTVVFIGNRSSLPA